MAGTPRGLPGPRATQNRTPTLNLSALFLTLLLTLLLTPSQAEIRRRWAWPSSDSLGLGWPWKASSDGGSMDADAIYRARFPGSFSGSDEVEGRSAKQVMTQGVPTSGLIGLCFEQLGGKYRLDSNQLTTRKWEGWGAALSWWTNYVNGYTNAQYSQVLNLIFGRGKNGLGLTIARYQIGGGFNPKVSIQFTNKTDPGRFRVMPGFKANKTAAYDWKADAGQRKALLGGIRRGVKKTIAYAMSAPWFMTVSGDVAGAARRKQCNLKSDYFSAFADYLADVVQQYAKAWNVTFDSLVPVNEALEGFWQKGQQHEGCYFSTSQLSTLYPLVSAALKKRKSNTTISGIESSAGLTASGVPKMTQSIVTAFKRLHVHGYVYNAMSDPAASAADVYSTVNQYASMIPKKIWQTEWGPLGCSTSGAMDTATCMARAIIESVNIMQSTVWMYWQVIDSDPNWTLISMPWTYKTFYTILTKKFFVLRQFSRSVLEGDVNLDVPAGTACSHSIAAFYSSTRKSLNAFLLNEQTASQSVTLTISGFVQLNVTGAASVGVSVLTTNSTVDWNLVQLRKIKLTGRSRDLTLRLPPASLTKVTLTEIYRPGKASS